HAHRFGRENAMCRPGSPFYPAPLPRLRESAPHRENVRSRIFHHSKRARPNDREQNVGKDRGSIWPLAAPPIPFREQCGLPAKEIQLSAKTAAAASPNERRLPTD